MKIRAKRAALAEALTWTAQAIDKQPKTPALAGIHLSACDGEVVLSGFDYDRSHQARVEVDVQDDGEALVSGHFLREIIAALKGDMVELVLDGSRLEILSGRSTYRINTIDARDFPKMPAFPKVVGQVEGADLAALIASVSHAAGRDLRLPILCTTRIRGEGAELSAVTTDRYRIARREVTWSPDADFEVCVMVPTIATALKGMSGTVTFGHQGGLFGLADERRRVTVRCIDDPFPKVDAFLVHGTDVEVDVDAADLAGAVRRATMAAGEHSIVCLDIAADGEIVVTAGSETSDAAEYVSCETTGPREVVFSGGYLADALDAAGTERVRLGFAGDPARHRPVTVTPIDGERIALVVMPRRAL